MNRKPLDTGQKPKIAQALSDIDKGVSRLQKIEHLARAYIQARDDWTAGKIPAAVEYERLEALRAALGMRKS